MNKSAPVPPQNPEARHNPFRVFRNRDYSLYFGGQLVSQAGTWMQQIAISWLTFKLSNSPVLLAAVGASVRSLRFCLCLLPESWLTD